MTRLIHHLLRTNIYFDLIDINSNTDFPFRDRAMFPTITIPVCIAAKSIRAFMEHLKTVYIDTVPSGEHEYPQ